VWFCDIFEEGYLRSNCYLFSQVIYYTEHSTNGIKDILLFNFLQYCLCIRQHQIQLDCFQLSTACASSSYDPHNVAMKWAALFSGGAGTDLPSALPFNYGPLDNPRIEHGLCLWVKRLYEVVPNHLLLCDQAGDPSILRATHPVPS
jgi:hypothetical protein